MVYPDCAFEYTVSVRAEGRSLRMTVDLDQLPDKAWKKPLYFNLELFPGLLFGKPWIMDDQQGIFPRQSVGPVVQQPSLYEGGVRMIPDLPEGYADSLMETGSAYSPVRAGEETAAPYAAGHHFVLCPEDPLLRVSVESLGEELKLFDGRVCHNNGWFVLSSAFSPDRPHAVEWRLTPNVVEDWMDTPRIQVSQADFSYIPGGVISGTALIRPDYPELKEWPFLWQQTEYVMGGGSSRFMFLVLAVQELMTEKSENQQ